MRRLWARIFVAGTTALLLLPQIALAAAKKAAPLVVVADTRKFSGWQAWWTNLYNESHFYFTLITVAAIPLVGLIFGLLADVIMGWIGLDLKHRDLAEH